MTGEPPLVFVTVGTDHHPFDRLVSWMDSWAAANLDRATCTIQTGTSSAPNAAQGLGYVGYEQMEALMSSATVIVCHGGPGTIFDARRLGHRPIVVPRRHDLGEHIDEHQVTNARRLASMGDIILAEHRGSLDLALSAALADPGSVRLRAPEDPDADATIRRFAEIVDPLILPPERGPGSPSAPARERGRP